MLSQRLVRKICDNCAESYSVSRKEIERIFIWDGKQEVKFFHGKGCENCRGTGYKGRIAIHEMVMVDDHMQELVTKNAPNFELLAFAKKIGYKPLRHDGIKKVLRGLTTIEENKRVTYAE